MTLESSIDVVLQEHGRWRRTLSIRVPPDIVRAELEQLARHREPPSIRKQRPTAAPEERGAPALEREMLGHLVPKAYQSALSRCALEPVSEGEVEAVGLEQDGSVAFRISFDVRPRIELSRLDGLRVARPQGGVRTEGVEAALERLREENAVWRSPEGVAQPHDGDLVTVQIVPLTPSGPAAARRAGSPALGSAEDIGLPWARRLRLRSDTRHQGRYQFLLGAGDALPALEDAVRSLAAGETREFTLSFPDEPFDQRPGGEQRLRITLKDWRSRELPDLDDTFARSLGPFRDLEALRRQIRADLEAEAAVKAQEELSAQLLDRVIEANPFDVPLSMVERHVESLLGNTSDADPAALKRARAELRPDAERAVKRRLVIDRIAETEGLAATDAELDARIAEIAQRGGVTAAAVRSRLLESGHLDLLVRDVTDRKVVAFLKSRSEVIAER
jgi:trigger factor